MSDRAFKGIRGRPSAAHSRAIARSRRTDAERRERMGELDDCSPFRPSRADLIVGQAAETELKRIQREGRS